MSKLNVCFVGVGSIAKRHIRNLHTICNERQIALTIDALRRAPEAIAGVDNVLCSVNDLSDNYDAVFITNPTEFHLESLIQLHDKSKHFFIEKPLVSLSQVDEARLFQTRNDSTYYIACPLRYNSVIQYIKNNIDPSEVISVRSISSSYLPDWRPGQDYRKTYSAHKSLGGGVSIDLIHEWDYMTYLFGWPIKAYSLIGKKSALEIDSDDYAIYIAEYQDKIAEMHLDYFGRKTVREIQLFTVDDTIIGDLENGTVRYMCSNDSIDLKEERDDYQKRELELFLDIAEGRAENTNEYEYGLKLLDLACGIV